MADPNWVDDLLPTAVLWKGKLAATSASLAVGDWFCIDPSDPSGRTATKAVAAALALTGAPLGICTVAALPGASLVGIAAGYAASSFTGLSAGAVQAVRINTTTARSERAASPSLSDYLVGIADTAGGVTIDFELPGTTGNVPAATNPTDDGKLLYASAGVWTKTAATLRVVAAGAGIAFGANASAQAGLNTPHAATVLSGRNAANNADLTLLTWGSGASQVLGVGSTAVDGVELRGKSSAYASIVFGAVTAAYFEVSNAEIGNATDFTSLEYTVAGGGSHYVKVAADTVALFTTPTVSIGHNTAVTGIEHRIATGGSFSWLVNNATVATLSATDLALSVTSLTWAAAGTIGVTANSSTGTGSAIAFTGQAKTGSGAGTHTGGAITITGGAASGATATHNGGAVTIIGGAALGASGTRTGGNVDMRGGVGNTTSGSVRLRTPSNSSTIVEVSATGLGLYGATPVVQAADPGALTMTVGTADGTIADVGAAFNQTTLNNNFRDLGEKYNTLRTILRNLGAAA